MLSLQKRPKGMFHYAMLWKSHTFFVFGKSSIWSLNSFGNGLIILYFTWNNLNSILFKGVFWLIDSLIVYFSISSSWLRACDTLSHLILASRVSPRQYMRVFVRKSCRKVKNHAVFTGNYSFQVSTKYTNDPKQRFQEHSLLKYGVFWRHALWIAANKQ